jgi:DNA-binding NtrC family response regulator
MTRTARLLAISPDSCLPWNLPERFAVETVASPPEALGGMRHLRPDAVLARFPLGAWTPAGLLEEVQKIDARIPVVICDGRASLHDAVRLARTGAEQVFASPTVEELAHALDEALEERRRRDLAGGAGVAANAPAFLVGRSRLLEDVARRIRLVGPRRCTVLITGESGTGKELAARFLHASSPRAARPMVAVNCHALPEHLLEAEMFGHVRGAFTGAVQARVGRFEQAHGSTLLLDEIGDMPLGFQAKLLRVLQEREFERLGSCETVRVDVRIVAATNVDLAERVRQGRFREDLYYRLNVVPVEMPPLRRRAGDVPLLAEHFSRKICRAEGISAKEISRAALDRLERYEWPGNVRQLENAVEMAVALSGDRTTLYPGDFSLPESQPQLLTPASPAEALDLPDGGLDFENTVNRIERSILEQALRRTGGNKKMAAAMLRLKRTTLAAKLRSLNARAPLN